MTRDGADAGAGAGCRVAPEAPVARRGDDSSGDGLAFWALFEGRWLVEVRREAGGRLLVFDRDAADAPTLDLPLGAVPAALPLDGAALARIQRRVEAELRREPATVRSASIRLGPDRMVGAGHVVGPGRPSAAAHCGERTK